MYTQIAQHLQERRVHPRTKGTAQNTHQMEETINLSNIYKMQMRIRNDRAVPEHLFPCWLTGLMLITCLLTHFPSSWTLAGQWVYHASLLFLSFQLVGELSCLPNTSFAVNYRFTQSLTACFPFCLALSVFTFLLLALCLFDNLLFSVRSTLASKVTAWLAVSQLMTACACTHLLTACLFACHWIILPQWRAAHNLIFPLFHSTFLQIKFKYHFPASVIYVHSGRFWGNCRM